MAEEERPSFMERVEICTRLVLGCTEPIVDAVAVERTVTCGATAVQNRQWGQ